MKKIKTDSIEVDIRQPFGARSAQHLQEGIREAIEAVVRGVVATEPGIVILYGAAVTRNGQDFSCSAGAAFYGGEVYQIQASVFTAPAGQVAVWQVKEIFAAGDPVLFTDLVPRNVHLIRTLELVAGVAGSGVADWDGVKTYSGLLELGSYAKKEQPAPVVLVNGGGVDYVNYPSLKYRKDTMGFVHLSGVRVAQSGEWNAFGFVLFGTLPEGFRPAEKERFTTSSFVGEQMYVDVLPDGEIRLSGQQASYAAQQHISFSGMTFHAL